MDGLEERVVAGAGETLRDLRLKPELFEVSDDCEAELISRRVAEEGFARVADFAEHSSRSLKGTPYESCVHPVFTRLN